MSGNWYLRSLGDSDTHYGSRNAEGKVVPLCCIDPFEPRPRMVVVGSRTDLQLVTGPAAFRGNPPDPDQICPACLTASR